MLLICFDFWSVVDRSEVDLGLPMILLFNLHGNLKVPKLVLTYSSIVEKNNESL
jgi:hypothetical protein